MNTVKIVNRTELNAAIYTKQIIKPAVEALRAITLQACNEDLGSHAEIQAFAHWIASFVTCADEIICQAEVDYGNRDKGLINRAFNRLSEIPSDIMRAEFEVKQLADSYSMKVTDLKGKGFNDDQIAQIVPDPKAEIERYTAIVTELNAEPLLISEFLADAPRFDVTLLAGTKVVLVTA